MSVPTRQFMFALLAIVFLVFAASAYGFDDTSSGPLVPEGLVVEDTFKPGLGPPVGKVQQVQGEVLIVHEGVLRGYRTQKDLPLYEGDTIITLEKGRIRFELKDGSTLTLVPETKLTISESVYDPTKKSRSSYIDVSVGKVRSVVTKLTGFKRSVFKVKTPTAVCGVRGSDFITIGTAARSEMTALEKTELGVLSHAFLEEEPLICTEFERAIVDRGKRPRKEKVTREEAERMKRAFLFAEGLLELEKWEGPDKEKEPGVPVVEEGVLVPEYELVKPGPLEEPEWPAGPDVFDREETSREAEEILDVRDEGAEQRLEDVLVPDLPPFPAPPRQR